MRIRELYIYIEFTHYQPNNLVRDQWLVTSPSHWFWSLRIFESQRLDFRVSMEPLAGYPSSQADPAVPGARAKWACRGVDAGQASAQTSSPVPLPWPNTQQMVHFGMQTQVRIINPCSFAASLEYTEYQETFPTFWNTIKSWLGSPWFWRIVSKTGCLQSLVGTFHRRNPVSFQNPNSIPQKPGRKK